MPIAPARLSAAPAIVRRSWKTPIQRNSPGRKSSPKTAITAVSFLSRSLRMRVAARQCSTTDWGSVPKDWMSAARAPPSIRTCTARENASPRFGSNSEILPGFTSDLCHSLLALSRSLTGLSRYAAEASACVAAVCPAEPRSGTCAPGVKSKPSFATTAPIAASFRTAACSQLPRPAHLLSWGTTAYRGCGAHVLREGNAARHAVAGRAAPPTMTPVPPVHGASRPAAAASPHGGRRTC